MRILLCVLWAMLLGACATAPQGVAGAGTKGEMHCKGPGAGPGAAGYPTCSDIPVVVLLSGTRCSAQLPYDKLVVHVGNGAQPTIITWRLIAPLNYRFTDRGITITKKNAGDPEPSTIYEKTPGPTAFMWKALAGARTGVAFDNSVNVNDPNGQACTAIDPTIINDN